MTTALADSVIMLRRKLKHMLRYPSVTLFTVLMPVAFLLLFVYILGGTIGPGHAGRAAYAAFITPGVLALTRAIGMVRNRATIPPVMSVAMETAVAVVAATAVSARMPGVMKVA